MKIRYWFDNGELYIMNSEVLMLAVYLQLIDTPDAKSDFEIFYHKYRKLMYYIALDIVNDSHLAEDVVSETFMNLAKRFDFIRTIGDISCPQIKRYVVISVKHTAFNMIKKDKRILESSFEKIDYEWGMDEPETIDIIIEKEKLDQINRVIATMPEIYKEVMQMYFVCEYDVGEVAKSLGITKPTAYKRIQRARKMIEKAMEA